MSATTTDRDRAAPEIHEDVETHEDVEIHDDVEIHEDVESPEGVDTADTDPAPFDAGELDATLGRMIDIISRLSDGDLHRAHVDGGWTVAQVVSHINVSAMMWLGDLARLRCDPDLRFFFREEVGHDLTGYPPPTVEIAVGQLASTRRSLSTSLAPMTAGLETRVVEIPDLGTRDVAAWTPLIAGHLIMHTGQVTDILSNRGILPDEV